MSESAGVFIDRARLLESVAGLARSLDRDTTAGVVRPWVSARLDHNVLGVSEFTQYGTNYVFRSDEAVERGGDGAAPSPLRYLLSSVAFCYQGWVAKISALHGADLESVRVDVRTMLDQRGELLVQDAPVHPQWFVVDLVTSGTASPDAMLAVGSEASRRCPVTALVARAAPVYYRLTHNSDLIRDDRPVSLQHEDAEEQTR
jgi:uncharacterized OsmC-like protein